MFRGDRLKELRIMWNESQAELASLVGVDRTTIGKYELKNIQPSADVLLKLVSHYNVTQTYLLGLDKEGSRPQGFRIPVLGRIPAGIPFEAIEEVLDFEELPIKMKSSGDYYGLKVVGNSMSPGICDGDTIIVRKQSVVDNKEVAVVLVNGNDATVKEVQFNQFGITLVGWNVADFPPRFFTVDEVENLPVSIIGKVIEVRRKL